MTWLDRYLQRRRIRVAIRYLPPGARVLDIGTHDGALFRLAGAHGIGIDPELAAMPVLSGVTLVKGRFPDGLPAPLEEPFDAATALAVVEHVPEDELKAWAEAVARLVVPHGVLVMTVPAPAVDTILHVLMKLRLVEGIEAHQHHGFHPGNLDAIFVAPLWQRTKHRTFQLGLNNVYVFERIASSKPSTAPAPAGSSPEQLAMLRATTPADELSRRGTDLDGGQVSVPGTGTSGTSPY